MPRRGQHMDINKLKLWRYKMGSFLRLTRAVISPSILLISHSITKEKYRLSARNTKLWNDLILVREVSHAAHPPAFQPYLQIIHPLIINQFFFSRGNPWLIRNLHVVPSRGKQPI